jgi:V/A-type H+-transporting ATPase subunit E
MSLEKIIERIDKEVKNNSEHILDEARKKEKEILDLAWQKAEEIHKQRIKNGEGKAQAVKDNILAQARLEQKKELLKTKQEQINEIYQKVFNDLLMSPTGIYQEFIKKMILEIMEQGKAELFISSRDEKVITLLFIDQVNKELKKRKQKGEIKLSSERVDINGGFILRQGKVELDNSFDTWMKVVREETEEQVISRLLDNPVLNK